MNKKPNVRRWRQPQAIQSQKDLDLLKLIATLELKAGGIRTRHSGLLAPRSCGRLKMQLKWKTTA